MLGIALVNGCRSATTSTYVPANSSLAQAPLAAAQAGWEPIIFRQIDELANIANLSRLRTSPLPNDDLEARFWGDAGYFGREGIVVRRNSGTWSGTYIRGASRNTNFKKSAQPLEPPRSGWNAAWRRLVEARVLNLPDASEVGCIVGGRDGIVFVFETNVSGTYRTYHYDNPAFAECGQAKEMLKMIGIINEEFGVKWPTTR